MKSNKIYFFESSKMKDKMGVKIHIYELGVYLDRAFSQLLKEGGKMAHRHNSCISSQMKLKLGDNIKWVMLTSNS